jgi:hypothetical protein
MFQEDPEIIGACFQLVEETKAEYGVLDTDIHNFDEIGFQIGFIGSMKVVTGLERRTKPDSMQPGDRKWVTVISNICADGSYTLPFIIYKGRIHISAWYKETSITSERKLSVS